MKTTKKVMAILLALVMVAALSVSAFAAASGPVDGSIKIENATNGQTYTAYKIFDATVDGNNVSYRSSVKYDDAPFTFTEQQDGSYVVEQKGTEAAVIQWIEANKNSFAKANDAVASDGSCTITGLKSGYYYVTSSLGTVISVDTVTGMDKVIKDKNNQGPNTPDKKITGESGDNSVNTTPSGNSNDAAVGSVESFEVSFNATNYVTSGTGNDVSSELVTVYNIVDEPTGLEIDLSTVEVTVGGTKLGADAFDARMDGSKLLVDIPWVDDSGHSLYTPDAGKSDIAVVVTYKATVTEDAATALADNTVTIMYNNKGTVGTDTTTTTTYKFELAKTDGSSPLTGAKFQLKKPDGSLVKFSVAEGVYTVGGTVDTIDMSDASEVTIQGLDLGNYTLVEVQAPDGYTLAPDKAVRAEDLSAANAENANTVTVVDEPGTPLPTTGSIGTTIFYILGSILVIGAGVVLVSKRRMTE